MTAPEFGEKWLGNIFGVLCGGRCTTGENFSGGINIKSPDELNDSLETNSHSAVPMHSVTGANPSNDQAIIPRLLCVIGYTA
jgi:hypothetical protein